MQNKYILWPMLVISCLCWRVHDLKVSTSLGSASLPISSLSKGIAGLVLLNTGYLEGRVHLQSMDEKQLLLITEPWNTLHSFFFCPKKAFKCLFFLYMCQKHGAAVVLNEHPGLVLETWYGSVLTCTWWTAEKHSIAWSYAAVAALQLVCVYKQMLIL